FEEEADDVEDAAQDVEGVLCHERHEREEGAAPVDGEKDEVDAHDAAFALPDLEVRRDEAGGEEDGGDRTDHDDGPLDAACVGSAQSEDEERFDAAEEDAAAGREERSRPDAPFVVVDEALRPADES
ncbi:hypothetical protein LTR16_011526, partial [Cryomyces antarcticus]